MKKPLIGIVCPTGPDPSNEEREIVFCGKPYTDRIVEAGGIPFLLAPGSDAAEVSKMIDGWMIIGGRDIDPATYGQKPHESLEQERPGRFELESAIYELSDPRMPVLGICYGCQFINVKRGGDLVQHLPDHIGNDDHSGGTLQDYKVSDGSLTATALESTVPKGKSYHHQAVSHVGNDLKVVAHSADGTIEAIEDTTGRWVLGIQWHPERTPENPESIALFANFMARARQFSEEKKSCGTW